MTEIRTYPEDRRYESFEMRAAYDERYVIRPKAAKEAEMKTTGYAAIACCKCGHVHTTLRCDGCGF